MNTSHEANPRVNPEPLDEIDMILSLDSSNIGLQPCIYFLVDNSEVVYVGQTKNVWKRLISREHRKKRYTQVFVLRSESGQDLGAKEQAYIRKYKPKYNVNGSLRSTEIQKIEEHFSARLRSLRAAAGISVSALADTSGLTRQYIRLLETGERTPAIETLRRLTKALGQESLSCWD